jgi:hypothetical protein
VQILNLSQIVNELRELNAPIQAAGGSDLLELMHLFASNDNILAEI